ncbi:MAG TPA: hypothetical protein ENN65_07530 [Candidatus Hydrogenedentes bacterium]|nr:hypothetical protein [Candidatus Hydrogenedentota bacterium]
MVEASRSSCINHPGVEATVRCKQCGTPVCDTCVESGPTGRFCSPACRQKHEAFMQRAQQMDGRARSGVFVKLRGLIGSIIIILVVLAVIGVAATLFPIPILSDLVFQLRGMLNI